MIWRATLVRHTFEDRPDWEIMRKEIPLGTVYYSFPPTKDAIIVNEETGDKRLITCIFVLGNDNTGWAPKDVFDIVEVEESENRRIAEIRDAILRRN